MKNNIINGLKKIYLFISGILLLFKYFFILTRKFFLRWRIKYTNSCWYISKNRNYYNPILEATVYRYVNCWSIARYRNYFGNFQSKEEAMDAIFKIWIEEKGLIALDTRLEHLQHQVLKDFKSKVLNNKINECNEVLDLTNIVDKKTKVKKKPLNKISNSSSSNFFKELTGEDRDFGGNKLYVDLIPESCWFNNVRTCIEPADWNELRKLIYARANHICECCGSSGPLEAHERWQFNEDLYVQKLIRIVALCKSCHEVTHIGLANVKGRFDIAIQHLMKVTKMSLSQANDHINQAFDIWESRNRYKWNLDLSILTDSQIKLSKSRKKN